jgi:tetratricopeptide (TPR) repeat protein
MNSEDTFYLELCRVYLDNAGGYPGGSTAFAKQRATLEELFYWLSGKPGDRYLRTLSELLLNYSPALEADFQHAVIADFIGKCLTLPDRTSAEEFEMLMIAYRAFWATGRWTDAEKYLRLAVGAADEQGLPAKATALQRLGSLQINKGDFQEAMRAFDEAKRLFKTIGEVEGENETKREEAAYYLDTGDFPAAERIYREVGDSEMATSGRMSNSSLLMIGVAVRRQGRTAEAVPFFESLLERAETSGDRNALAVALHHLAWAQMNLRNYEYAGQLADRSQKLYHEINDPRGESDVDEQLGELAQFTGNYTNARFHYECAFNTRKLLGNKQGMASVSRRMARLHLRQHKYLRGFFYLARSTLLYIKNGMFNKRRLTRGVREVLLRQNIASYPR